MASDEQLEKESERPFVFSPFEFCNNISFLVGYFIAQQQEAKKREKWAEMFFRQAKDWLTERGRKEARGSRSAVEQAASKGAEYGRLLNPFSRKLRCRFFGIL